MLFLRSGLFLDSTNKTNNSAKIAVHIDPRTYVDFLKIIHRQYFDPGVTVIEKRLSKIDEIASQRGLIAKHIISYAYGSGFLNFNQVGNDLDYGNGVDLGLVKFDTKRPEKSAAALIKRVEDYLNITKELFDRNNSTELSGFSFSHVLNKQGVLPNRYLITKSLASQLTKLVSGKTVKKIVKSTHVNYVPIVLKKNEAILDSGLLVSYFSNKIKFSEQMLPGIREISVAYYFIFLLEVNDGKNPKTILNCILYPTFFSVGRVFDPRENLFLNVWINEKHYQTFLKRVFSPKPDEFKELLHQHGGKFIMLARDEMVRVRKIKMIKRIHQAFDGLKGYLKEKDKMYIAQKLQEWLGGPAATIIETFKEESSILKSLIQRPSLYKMYLENGDIAKILNYFSQSVLILGKEYHSETYMRLKQHVDLLLHKDPQELTAEDFNELKKISVEFQNEILPDKTEFEHVIEMLQETLKNLGYLLVRINGISPTEFSVNIYDLNDVYKKVPGLDYLKKRGFPVFENTKYTLSLKKEIDGNRYSKTYWLSP